MNGIGGHKMERTSLFLAADQGTLGAECFLLSDEVT